MSYSCKYNWDNGKWFNNIYLQTTKANAANNKHYSYNFVIKVGPSGFLKFMKHVTGRRNFFVLDIVALLKGLAVANIVV